MNKREVGFVGSGNMAYAIAKGIVGANILSASSIMMYDIDNDRLNELKAEGYATTNDISEIAKSCKYLFLSVFPQICGEVLEAMSVYLTKDSVIVSIAAGISSKFIKEKAKADVKTILVMPNTPLRISYSSTAISRIEPTTKEEFDFVTSLFGTSGHTEELPENLMKEVIPVNGSSPAFMYRLALSVVTKAKTLGIEEEAAKKLFCHAMIGAAKMMLETDYSLEDLIEMVSTPGGATIEGLKSLQADDIDGVVSNCMDKTINRAYELGK